MQIMDNGWRVLAGTCVMMIGSAVADAATIYVPQGFDSGKAEGWSGASGSAAPKVMASGGPQGAGDEYLLATSLGGGGRGSHLAVYQTSAAWVGDLQGAGAKGLSVDLMNPTSSQPLTMRLVVFGPRVNESRWTSTAALSIPNDGQWHRFYFPLGSSVMTRVAGNASYDQTAKGALRLMLRHDTLTPSSGGTAIRAQLGIDNIALVPEPAGGVLLATGNLVLIGVAGCLFGRRRARGQRID
ncbi:MAG: hypothetical protein U0795_08105 [Pirellulales bacterium]